MDKNKVIQNSIEVVKNAKIAMLGTVDESGTPNIKAMLNLKSDGLNKIWFSTNTSSRRVNQILNNDKACVYYYNDDFMGLMLVGKIKVMQDEESRKMLWFDGCERYYPGGINDPDYSVLCFTAERGDYYYNLEKMSFEVE